MAPQIPMVSVPVEPTEAMLDAFSGTRFCTLPPAKQEAERKAYATMLTAAPVRAEGVAATLDRDAMIALIMEETTDDIVADGWDRLGKPNVLVQGCRYIRRNAPPSPEGYANPEASAKQFAGFIADRLLAALSPEAQASTCQKCGGEIAGWHCQKCPTEFRENDAGVLIIDDETPAEGAGERLTAEQVWAELLEKSDRNSPEDRPGMLLITWEEMADYMNRARSSAPEAPSAGAM